MKKIKISKNLILGFTLGLVVAGGVSAAAITLTTKDIKFKPNNPNWKATNLDQALNDLYKIGDYKVPANTYFYDKTTLKTGLKTYKKVDGKYYECDKFGKVAEGIEPSQVEEKNLVVYKEIDSDNLKAGSAGYANKDIVLGDGKNFLLPNNTFKYIEGYDDSNKSLTSSVKIPDGYKIIMGFMGNGKNMQIAQAYQVGIVFWDGHQHIKKDIAHITVDYNPITNIFSGTSSSASNTRTKYWRIYIAPDEYFN